MSTTTDVDMSVTAWELWKPPFFVRGTFKWEQVNDGTLPEGVVHTGIDKNGTVLFGGRANHDGDLLPAKVTKEDEKYIAYVSYNGQEYKKDVFEALISEDIAWIKYRDGEIPLQAIGIGKTSAGEMLYFGRTFHDGTLVPGKVHPSHKCLYFPYSGKEIKSEEYEIMILL